MENCDCSNQVVSTLDMATPFNVPLTAYYKRSFAHFTVKSRMPVILTQLIDGLVRSKEELLLNYGQETLEELKGVIGELAKFKYEMQTNKQIAELKSKGNDIVEYNNYLKNELDRFSFCTYFSTNWLFVECYMYRRIAEIFSLTKTLNTYDYFGKQKREAFNSSIDFIVPLAYNLDKINSASRLIDSKEDLRKDFYLLLNLNLWGNKCDLSLSLGKPSASAVGLLEKVDDLNKFILCDQSDQVFDAVCRSTMCEFIDIVCDNAGYEIFTDLCLADFLTHHGFAQRIRLYVKAVPWFISDVTKDDIPYILDLLCDSDEDILQKLGTRWKEFLANKVWTIEESPYWTTHFDFAAMYEKDNSLFRKLARAKCTFYKGDLNYRKLLGDINWDPTTPLEDALRGFHASRLCAIRTLKSDLVCGLEQGVAESAAAQSAEWMISGEYGVIQYSGKVKKLF